MASAGYRWYLGAQVVSLAGTTMGYTSLFWLVLHIPTATLVVSGVALQLLAVSATVYIQQATPAAQRGLALSAYNAGFIGFVPAGAFAVAGIASLAGVPWALIWPGLAVLGGGALAIAARPRRPGGRTWLAAGRR